MINRYIVKIDRLCPICGFLNKTEIKSPKPIEIAACGKCGDIFMCPEDTSEEDMKELKKVVLKGIREREL